MKYHAKNLTNAPTVYHTQRGLFLHSRSSFYFRHKLYTSTISFPLSDHPSTASSLCSSVAALLQHWFFLFLLCLGNIRLSDKAGTRWRKLWRVEDHLRLRELLLYSFVFPGTPRRYPVPSPPHLIHTHRPWWAASVLLIFRKPLQLLKCPIILCQR